MAYITADDLKSYMKINGNADQTQLGYFADRAQHIIDEYTNRVFEAAADTTRYYTPIVDRAYYGLGYQGSLIDSYTLDLRWDLCQLTSIVNGDGSSIPTNQVTLEPLNITPANFIHIKTSSGYYWTYTGSPEGSVRITGRFAYSITAPANIVQAALRIGAYLYRQRDMSPDNDRTIVSADGVVMSAPRIPSDVVDLLRSYKRRS
jgi:hypothetical protein